MMRKWKKRMCQLALVITLLGTVTVAATEVPTSEVQTSEVTAENNVYDDANLLTDAEIAELNAQILNLKNLTDWDVFAVTTNDANGKSAMEYADDFYDERTEVDSHGVLVLIDMDNREIYISTYGEAIRYLTDARIERILDEGFYYVSDGEYYNCFNAMLSVVREYYKDGIHQDQYNYDVDTGAISEYRSITTMELGATVLVGALVAAGIYFGVTKSYSIKGGKYEYPYMKYSKIDIIEHEDRYIRTHTTHHRIERNTSSGGGRSSGGGHRSSTHRSSSGRSHGGGGRKF